MIFIELTQGKRAIVDQGDLKRLSRHKWFAHAYRSTHRTYWYANTKLGGATIPMHRFILGAETGQLIDHLNGDGLDNRRGNLRFCNRSENSQNGPAYSPRPGACRKSSFRGVSWHRKKWRAQIEKDRRDVYLGLFEDEAAAAKAYDTAARELYGEHAATNF